MNFIGADAHADPLAGGTGTGGMNQPFAAVTVHVHFKVDALLDENYQDGRLLVEAHAAYNKNLNGGYHYGGSNADYVTVTEMETLDALYLTSDYYRLGLSATYSQQLKEHSHTHLFAKAAFDYTHAQEDRFSHRSVLSVSLGCNF